MTLEKSTNQNDRIFDTGSFKIAINKDFDKLYQNLEIDYISDYRGKGFIIAEKGRKSSSCC